MLKKGFRISLGSLVPALNLLDLHEVTRNEFYQSVFDQLKLVFERRIEDFSKKTQEDRNEVSPNQTFFTTLLSKGPSQNPRQSFSACWRSTFATFRHAHALEAGKYSSGQARKNHVRSRSLPKCSNRRSPPHLALQARFIPRRSARASETICRRNRASSHEFYY